MQSVLKFKNSAPGPDHTPFSGILSCVRSDQDLPYTKFDKYTVHVPENAQSYVEFARKLQLHDGA